MMNGQPADLESIDQTIILVKALPISEDYFNDIVKTTVGEDSNFDDLQNIPDHDMKLIFNYLNKIILFTMFNLCC